MLPEERVPLSERLRRRPGVRTPMMILGITMCVIYIALGSYLLLNKSFLPNIPTDLRNIFAVMVLVYGIYRGWRIYADFRQ